jgi:hypothetical protein
VPNPFFGRMLVSFQGVSEAVQKLHQQAMPDEEKVD